MVAQDTCQCRWVEMRRDWAACLPPILYAERWPDRDAFFVRLAITWNGDLPFVNALFGRRVKHLIRIIITRCEIDMENIKRKLSQDYNEILSDLIKVIIF